jgi:hypothetical protein
MPGGARNGGQVTIGIMESWNDGILGLYSTPFKNITIHEISISHGTKKHQSHIVNCKIFSIKQEKTARLLTLY